MHHAMYGAEQGAELGKSPSLLISCGILGNHVSPEEHGYTVSPGASGVQSVNKDACETI